MHSFSGRSSVPGAHARLCLWRRSWPAERQPSRSTHMGELDAQ